jgi:hypothetical protein
LDLTRSKRSFAPRPVNHIHSVFRDRQHDYGEDLLKLGESVRTTPAIADHVLYVRSAESLWAFGHKPE